MVNISGSLSVGQVTSYYQKDFCNGTENKNYFEQAAVLQGEWHGKFAEEMGLIGAVDQAHYNRLALGQNPHTGEQWIKHRDSMGTQSKKEKAHRAAWDMTFGATKSVSLQAFVGGDQRILAVHRDAVKLALDKGEAYTQARMGGDRPAMTTGKWAVALFEHDVARPVTGPPMPHIHTHAVLFNMTKGGKVRSLDPREIFRVQAYMSAVYHSEMALGLKRLGYLVEQGENYSTEIKGFSPEYKAAMSERRQEIEAELRKQGVNSAKAAQIIAHRTRNNKQPWDQDALRSAHKDISKKYGDQEEPNRLQAHARGPIRVSPEVRATRADAAVTFARRSLSEREAIFDESSIIREALRRGRGYVDHSDVQSALQQQIEQGRFIATSHWRQNAPGSRYTTPETLNQEASVIRFVHDGINQMQPLSNKLDADAIGKRNPLLNQSQREALASVIASSDRVMSLQGGAGTGKTTVLKTLKKVAEQQGFSVKGFAPSGRARNELHHAGIDAVTLQRHLTQGETEKGRAHYYILDESSLASTAQMHKLLSGLSPKDRVLLVGDIKQHGSVEAGRIFSLLQRSGMSVAHLDQIVRQKDAPELMNVVQKMADGKIFDAVKSIAAHGWINEVASNKTRYQMIAEEFGQSPTGTLVISPDNESRQTLNQFIRRHLQSTGMVQKDAFSMTVLVGRQDITGEQRKVASYYRVGDTVRFLNEQKAIGVNAKSYVKVVGVDAERNVLAVQKADGTFLSYNPGRHYGVSLYNEEQRSFAVGDRVQFTSPIKAQSLANRDFGTILSLDHSGNAKILMDGNEHRKVRANLAQMRHLDYGYTTTSYSSQSVTVDRTLVNIETQNSRTANLVGRQLGYVAFSRPRHQLLVYTDDQKGLANQLNKYQEKPTAVSPKQAEAHNQAAKGLRVA